MKRFAALFFAVFFACAACSSCSARGDSVSCREIIESLTAAEISLPAGKIYDGRACEGDAEYLPDSFISALLGGGSLPEISEGWIDVAFFISLNDHPCEFAAILCSNSDVAEDSARLLSVHLNYVKLIKGSDEYSAYTDGAIVTVVGNYAILIISSDSENALKQIKKLI